MAAALHQRLLHDIHELQAKPYPNIYLHVYDEEITKACLVLTAEGYGPMHLTVHIPPQYPLLPPEIRMDSDIKHPNVYGSYICASILNTQDGYTPAYTLKGIAIQLLSFFSSDRIEQTGGGYHHGLSRYRQLQSHVSETYVCTGCGFGIRDSTTSSSGFISAKNQVPPPPPEAGTDPAWPTPQESTAMGNNLVLRAKLAHIPQSILDNCARGRAPQNNASAGSAMLASKDALRGKTGIQKVPDEILLLICDKLETEDLMVFAEAWNNIGLLMTKYDIIRTRELQCFIFKQNYTETELGVGVSIVHRGRMGTFESEFDLLSEKAFKKHGHRRSTQAIPFQYWLPLPLSYGHWKRVKDEAPRSLSDIGHAATLGSTLPSKVIFHFMNDIVVKLNEHTTQASPIPSHCYGPQSTLTHASEKAIESYFHLFHLLLCLATAQRSIVDSANNLLRSFMQGNTSKTSCPNLGHLLVAALISDVDMTENLLRAIIKETVTRNVVWMLDKKGANMPELAYIEPSAVSNYRLKKSFEASKTSYRLLMFLSLFLRTAVGSPRRPLNQLRDEAFERHGAPPRGSAKGLAESIKRIHQVETFPNFLVAMGIKTMPTAESFTNFLRGCIKDSVIKGYSKNALTENEAFTLRRAKEPDVAVRPGLTRMLSVDMSRKTFFPEAGRGGGGNHQPRDGRGGRGRGRR